MTKRRSVWIVEHKDIVGYWNPAIGLMPFLKAGTAMRHKKEREKLTGDEYRVVRYDASK